jgi:glycerophosphoryl diester phosphodiesterase
MLDKFPQPIVFAHRGAAAYAPENTMASFREEAQNQGADGIELDVKLSRDGQVVVFHDPTLERTTDGKGRLCNMTFHELRTLDAGSHFSSTFRGEPIPLLEEVLTTFHNKLLINIELTNYTTPLDNLVTSVCELVRKYALQSGIIFSSFLASNLAKAARLLPEIPRALLCRPGWRGIWSRSFGFTFGSYTALHPFIEDVNQQQIQRVHRLQRRVHVWTVKSQEEITRLWSWGVDGIFTVDPKLALTALRRGT